MSGVLRTPGHHAPWSSMPERVRAWAANALEGEIVGWEECAGGMSPGCATRVVTGQGRRGFVKAVGADLNPDTPTLFRREILTLGLLGEDPRWAGRLGSYDDGDWVALLLEDVEGRHPDPDDEADAELLMAATDDLVTFLHERLPTPPAPDPEPGGLLDLPAHLRRWADALERLEEVPPELCPAWLLGAAGRHAEHLRSLTSRPGTQLVHWDIRHDNLLVRPDGRLVFLDWGQAGVGYDWFDPLLARLDRAELPWFDEAVGSSPALARAGDDAITTFLVGIGGFLAWRATVAVDVNLPALAGFRRRESARFLEAARRRLGRRAA
ncbi:phosphotransferase [Nocardioides acrostichi]|uniref:Phosphotransferase n=1 Tax=Nocardioides acrostichi TaxID=2784339 RepID=A0A930Y8P5_9ACTN|nr:phosphotransferase [Nocardioides acrostichi]MBF4163327.1 phosphotransferase [Nocardioides acrostichi]